MPGFAKGSLMKRFKNVTHQNLLGGIRTNLSTDIHTASLTWICYREWTVSFKLFSLTQRFWLCHTRPSSDASWPILREANQVIIELYWYCDKSQTRFNFQRKFHTSMFHFTPFWWWNRTATISRLKLFPWKVNFIWKSFQSTLSML